MAEGPCANQLSAGNRRWLGSSHLCRTCCRPKLALCEVARIMQFQAVRNKGVEHTRTAEQGNEDLPAWSKFRELVRFI